MIHNFLDNGLEYIIKQNNFSDLLCIQCWVWVGSIHEGKTQRGMSHLIEHMLFKGTKKRRVGEIAAIIEQCGGEINAYTSFDRTVYYLTINSEHLETGIDVLSDALFYSSFDPDELHKEKEVICEEIRRYLDDPSSQIIEKTFSYAFKGTEASRPIIGYEKNIKNFKRSQILNYYHNWYRPDNISVVILGNIDEYQAQNLVKKYFSDKKNKSKSKKTINVTLPQRSFPKGIKTSIIKGDFKKSQLQIAFKAPSFENIEAVALDLATFALGGAQSSRLVRTIQDQLQLVSDIDASIYAPKFGGISIIHATPVEGRFLDAITAIAREITNFKYLNHLSEKELDIARANYKSSYFFQKENITRQASKLGFSIKTLYKYIYEDISMLVLDKINLSTILNAIQKWFDENNVIIVGLVSKDTKINALDLKKAFIKGIHETKLQLKQLASNVPSTSLTVNVNKPEKNYPQIIPINDGITLVYRYNENSEVFCLVAATEGGLRSENFEIAGINYAISLMLGKGTKTKNYAQLLDIIESAGANIEGFCGKDSLGLKLECLKEQAEKFIPLFFECLKAPHFYDDPWTSIHKEILETIRSQQDLPSKICMRKFAELIFKNHPYKFALYGHKESVQKFNAQNILEHFEYYKNEGPWVLGCIGPKDNKKIIELIKENCADWNPKGSKRILNNQIPTDIKFQKEHVFKDREQTHIAIGNLGLSWFSPKRYSTDILINILEGQGGRLFINLRDKQSLAYTVSAICTYGYDCGVIGAYIACAPTKEQQAIEGLIQEFKNLAYNPPTEDEIQRAKNYIIGTHNMDFQKSASQAMSMALMELYGLGAQDFLDYPDKIRHVSSAEIYEQSKHLLDIDNLIIVSVGPKIT